MDSSAVLSRVWHMTPGFILWHVCKERNNGKFKDKASPEEDYWRKIHSSIKETLNLQNWTEEDLECNSQEQHI